MHSQLVPGRHDPYAALRLRNFRFLCTANVLVAFSSAILTVIIGWSLYERTHSAFILGLVGLVQIIPNLLLAIPAGHYVDQHDPRRVAAVALVLQGAATGFIAWSTWQDGPLWAIFAALFVIGTARALRNPTYAPLLSGVVDESLYQNASAWNGGADHTAAIVGPAVGGFAVALTGDSAPIFLVCALLMIIAAVALLATQIRQRIHVEQELSRDALLAGARFIRSTPIMLGAITLDMFAVLLGGATALLPIFADEILHVGAGGLGLMRAAPAAGALLTSVVVAHRGPFLRAGRSLLFTVAGFGIATVVFGLSRWFPLSVVALLALGAFDSVSMIIREVIELRFTPDDMRGRVASIHFLFIGMSNEFGEFESGLAAALIGASAAVVLGGIGTLLVVATIARTMPELRGLARIEPEARPLEAAPQPTGAL